MSVRLLPEHDLNGYIGETERLLYEEDPQLLSSLKGKPYQAEALRYIFLTHYHTLFHGLLSSYSSEDILFTRFFWHNVVRGIIQSVEPDSLLFLGDMDDILGSPSAFFDSADLDDLYEHAESYI